MLCGISRYAQLHGPWSFHIRAGDFEHELPNLKQWKGHGIIARIPNVRVARAVLEANLPTVAVGLTDEQMLPDSPLSRFSEVSSDAKEVVRIAAEHLLGRGLRNFAYVGMEDRAWSQRRAREFREFLENAGHTLHLYEQPSRVHNRRWEKKRIILAEWLYELPKPIGLFACNDDRGREVLEACRLAELNVPEEVAVLGVDNDEVFCGLADPPLSSVALNAETAGCRAAEVLDEMMQGKTVKPRRIVVEALKVVTRRSTNFNVVGDRDVGAALQFIHRSHGDDISVDLVAEQVAISRRMLEKRFRKVIGRSILEEIQLTRLQRAMQLLLETSYPVSRIAALAGFNTTAYFVQLSWQDAASLPHGSGRGTPLEQVGNASPATKSSAPFGLSRTGTQPTSARFHQKVADLSVD